MSVFGIGPAELVFVFVLALIFIGPGKMPEVAASVGKALREFQKASAELTDALSAEVAAVQAAKDAAFSGEPVAGALSTAAGAAISAADSGETSARNPVEVAPVAPAPEAEPPSATAEAEPSVVAEPVASPIFPPVVDPTGMAELPAALLDPSDSMRRLSTKSAAALAASAIQTEA